MPFDPKSARNAGKKSKRGPAKKEESTIKQKMELLYEEILDELLVNQNLPTLISHSPQTFHKNICNSVFIRVLPNII